MAATGARAAGHPFAHDDRAGEEVAEPLALRGEASDAISADRAEGEPDLDHAQQPAHERLPEPAGPPSSRTTRSPIAILPERPARGSTVSTATG